MEQTETVRIKVIVEGDHVFLKTLKIDSSMSTTGIIIVVIIVALVVGWASWFTAKKFRNIESNKTNRRTHIDEDVKVDKNE